MPIPSFCEEDDRELVRRDILGTEENRRGYRRESGEVGSDGLWSCLSSGMSDTYIEESLAAWSSDVS